MAKRTRKAAAPKPAPPAASDGIAAGRKHVEKSIAAMTPAERERLQQQQRIFIGTPIGTTIPWTPVAVGPIRPRPEITLLREIRDIMSKPATPPESQPPWRADGLGIEERLEELVKAKPECVGLGSRPLGELIGKSHTAVQRTAWFQERKEARELAKRHRKAISRGEYLDQYGN